MQPEKASSSIANSFPQPEMSRLLSFVNEWNESVEQRINILIFVDPIEEVAYMLIRGRKTLVISEQTKHTFRDSCERVSSNG